MWHQHQRTFSSLKVTSQRLRHRDRDPYSNLTVNQHLLYFPSNGWRCSATERATWHGRADTCTTPPLMGCCDQTKTFLSRCRICGSTPRLKGRAWRPPHAFTSSLVDLLKSLRNIRYAIPGFHCSAKWLLQRIRLLCRRLQLQETPKLR